jgi:mono/diheme cytochrome c family protein
MIRFMTFVAIFAAAPAMAQEAVTLKPGPGLEVVTTTCSNCHTLNYIRMNSVFLNQEGWKAEVTKMQQAFGGPFDDATAATIVAYLSANYSMQP